MSRSTCAPVHQSNTSHVWTVHGCNLEQLYVFKALRVGPQMHQSTSQKNSHALSIHGCNQEQISVLCSTSWSTSAPVSQSNTSHTWTIHGCNPEQICGLVDGCGAHVHSNLPWRLLLSEDHVEDSVDGLPGVHILNDALLTNSVFL